MDDNEARALLAERVMRYRKYSHAQLAGLVGSCETEDAPGRTGTMYQLEFQFFWDAQPDGNVRVVGSIDDGGLRSFVPLCHGFIKAPDGTFVGE